MPLLPSSPSDEDTISHDDLERLDVGRVVSRPLSFRTDHGKYIGAVSHVVSNLRPSRVLDLIFDVTALPSWLPFNHATKIVHGSGDDLVVEMLQGVDPFLATFSMKVTRRDPTIRWTLDPERPHDIDDVRGFFSARPWDRDRSVVTTGLAVDLGTGVLRVLEREVMRVLPDATADARDYLRRKHFESAVPVRVAPTPAP